MSFKIPITFVLIFYLLLLGTSSCIVNDESAAGTSIPPTTLEIEEPQDTANAGPPPGTEATPLPEEILYACGTAKEAAIAENTSQIYQVSTIEIMDYYCQGISFDYITLALETTRLADVSLQSVIEMLQSGKTWEQIWQDLGILFVECGSPEEQGIAQDIAENYGATYEDVLGLFCQGFTFDEVLLAMETAAQTGSSAQDILNKRRDGKSWDDIWEDLGVIE